jgi:hypothetical protein
MIKQFESARPRPCSLEQKILVIKSDKLEYSRLAITRGIIFRTTPVHSSQADWSTA